MSLNRQVTKVGGSLAVIIPRDVAELMGVQEGSPISVSVVGRQLVVEPQDDTMDKATFRRAYATVLRRYAKTFKRLAERDRT